MAIVRVFTVTVADCDIAEFEASFSTISLGLVKSSPGCSSVQILKPTKYTPRDYAMISEWESEAALEAFAHGEWNNAVIPKGMEHLIESCDVSHFIAW